MSPVQEPAAPGGLYAEAIVILVVGSTGAVGGAVTRRLLAQRRTVRILVRRGSNSQPLVGAGAQPVLGDLKDPPSLATACRGVDTLITTASGGQRGGADTPETVDVAGNRNLIDAARAAHVGQFIFVSTLSADEKSPAPLPRAKAMAEKHLRESGLPYTVLAANGILDVWLPVIVAAPLAAGRPVTLMGEGRKRHSFVAGDDIAAFAVAALGHPRALNQRLLIGGPEAVSWRDIVATYERVLGREIPIRWIAPGQVLPDLPPGLAQLVSGLMAALETYESPVDMDEAAQTFAVQLTSLEQFVRRATASQPPVPA